MMITTESNDFYIGWDVGGWNCDRNGASRDALVILNEELSIVGEPWRGNLREHIVKASATTEWLTSLFTLCQLPFSKSLRHATLAIDTPLGFPDEFIALITGQGWIEPDHTSGRNRYLFRHTERHLFERGLKPLSSIKDMIGSQATKGMHVLAKFASKLESCGVWQDGHGFHAIETYPTVWRETSMVQNYLIGRQPLAHTDLDDALICALVAHQFVKNPTALEPPPPQIPTREGWIWAPKQAKPSGPSKLIDTATNEHNR